MCKRWTVQSHLELLIVTFNRKKDKSVTNEITEPMYIGQIDEDIFGKVDLYQISLAKDIQDIFSYRTENDLNDEIHDEFYVLAPFSKFGTKSTTSASYVPIKIGEEPLTLFKAHFHDVGHFLELVKSKEMDIKSSLDDNGYAWFTMPRIPVRMVAELKKFFFTVEDKYGTEGIVLLTFDMDYINAENAYDGWGFAVPPQENTAGHCNYDKAPVVSSLPENIRIVGTAHSHPKMSAFASSTDHDDQAGFDGLHITFGWKDNKVEYYSELVRGTNFYQITPDKVMDLSDQFQYKVTIDGQDHYVTENDLELLEVQHDVDEILLEEWCTKVSKQSFTHVQHHHAYGRQELATGKSGDSKKALPATAGQTHKGSPNPGIYDARDVYPDEIPRGVLEFGMGLKIPDPRTNNIFVLVDDIKTECPTCQRAFGFIEVETLDRRQCLFCGAFFIKPGESIEDVDLCRQTNGYKPFVEFLDMNIPFFVWDSNKDEFYELGDSKKALSA